MGLQAGWIAETACEKLRKRRGSGQREEPRPSPRNGTVQSDPSDPSITVEHPVISSGARRLRRQ